MLWVPKNGVLRVQHNLGSVGSANVGTAVTTGGAASTKGSYAELIASTSFDAWWVTILITGYGTAATDARLAVDIGIGAATEEILIADLLAGNAPLNLNAGSVDAWDFPLWIPAGSRITARGAGDRVSTAFRVGIILRGGDGSPPFRPAGRVETYGMGTVPAGTTVVPGASGAEGAWTQIVASTTRDHFAFLPSFQCGLDTSKSAVTYFVDLGLGAATEEMMIGGESFIMGVTTSEDAGHLSNWFPVFHEVPSGTRLVMRASNSGANDSGNYNGVIHALS
jgi:hypothetical protein